MKLVLNKCYGGFGLSDGGLRNLAARKGITLFEEDHEFWTEFYLDAALTEPFPHREIERTDPILIDIVEEFGALANGPHAKLEIISIPSGQQYHICEYDGKEWLEFPSDITWLTAT